MRALELLMWQIGFWTNSLFPKNEKILILGSERLKNDFLFIRRRKPTPNLLTITSYFLLPKNSVGIFGRGWKNFFKLLIIHLQAGLY